MKKVLIIGAGGNLAGKVIDSLIAEKNIRLTLFLRQQKKLRNIHFGNVVVMEGDVMDYATLKVAVQGQDIIYVNLAGNLEAMGKNIVRAMKEAGVTRVLAISSIGIYASPVPAMLLPYRKLADVIEESGLDYTILRPTWFSNADEIDYEVTHKGEPEKGTVISQKSIAAFIKTIIESPDLHSRKNLGINKPNS